MAATASAYLKDKKPLKGTKTTKLGILTLVLGAFGLFGQIEGAVKVGAPVDADETATAVSAIISGIGLIKAADSKQEEEGGRK